MVMYHHRKELGYQNIVKEVLEHKSQEQENEECRKFMTCL